jgi:hypothetical protein
MSDVIARILIPRLSTIPVNSSGQLLISQEDYIEDDEEEGESYLNPESQEVSPAVKIDITKLLK